MASIICIFANFLYFFESFYFLASFLWLSITKDRTYWFWIEFLTLMKFGLKKLIDFGSPHSFPFFVDLLPCLIKEKYYVL